jgi:hypothetical protein
MDLTFFDYDYYKAISSPAITEAEFNAIAPEVVAYFANQLEPFITVRTQQSVGDCLTAMINVKYADDKELAGEGAKQSESIAGYSYTLSDATKTLMANKKTTSASYAYYAHLYCGLTRALC